jgi:Zn-dependent peptidase ImmA (M78 family)
MPARDVAYISPATVEWARKRAGLSPEELSVRLRSGISPSHITAWETGHSLPTFSQAEKLANKLHLPFAILFMSVPPKIGVAIPDLRTVHDVEQYQLSLASVEMVNDALLRQEWYKEYLEAQESRPVPFVGKFNVHSDILAVAEDMRQELNLDDKLRHECATWQQFLTAFVQRAESAGVLVMRSGVVRHDTSRKLDTKEFRGFAITDDLAPVVFINTTDAKAAQIFTLAHELAHIWIGVSGISNPHIKEARTPPRNVVERFCNRVAAELLVPHAGFQRLWTPALSPFDNAKAIAKYYRVSTMVVLIRAYERHKISYDRFAELMNAEYARFAQREEEAVSGGNFWASFSARSSPKLTQAITGSVQQGQLPYRDAARLLGVKVSTLNRYIELQAAH